jgi:hypothetical protein
MANNNNNNKPPLPKLEWTAADEYATQPKINGRPKRPLPKLAWTAADERAFLARKERQEEIQTIGQTATAWAKQNQQDTTPANNLLAWAFRNP